MDTLFLCTLAELESDISACIASFEQASPPRKPTWGEIWAVMMQKARTVTNNLWQCVVNRRWASSSQIGSESASELIDLLLSDLAECDNTAPVFTLPPVEG